MPTFPYQRYLGPSSHVAFLFINVLIWFLSFWLASPEPASAETHSTTCWPPGRGASPTRSEEEPPRRPPAILHLSPLNFMNTVIPTQTEGQLYTKTSASSQDLVQVMSACWGRRHYWGEHWETQIFGRPFSFIAPPDPTLTIVITCFSVTLKHNCHDFRCTCMHVGYYRPIMLVCSAVCMLSVHTACTWRVHKWCKRSLRRAEVKSSLWLRCMVNFGRWWRVNRCSITSPGSHWCWTLLSWCHGWRSVQRNLSKSWLTFSITVWSQLGWFHFLSVEQRLLKCAYFFISVCSNSTFTCFVFLGFGRKVVILKISVLVDQCSNSFICLKVHVVIITF